MPRILIYEECLAAYQPGPIRNPTQDFLTEGLAMVLAVAEDFARLTDWQVRVMRSTDLITSTPKQVTWTWVDVQGDLDAMLAREASAADTTLVIAPECGGLLQQRAQAVLDAGGTLLGPASAWIAFASDKTAVIDHLAVHRIRTPKGVCDILSSITKHKWTYPVVLKPNAWAGASDVQIIHNEHVFIERLLFSSIVDEPARYRCEEFIAGQAASVAVLCGPSGHLVLRPSTQIIIFDHQGRAEYHGGSLNLSPALEVRVRDLAEKTIHALPLTRGYIGIDLILGEAADGSMDTVIEVNPRLTTSYIGLRRATHQSLADAMWRIAQGETVNISWLPNNVEFTKQGQVSIRERS